ncbi:MAG TPA: outer membrane lipid asymmetry maintenance protein MlaD [Gammaproteobacteria bacterium]|nr:outer membrane lipid asymmetry maintenance protein MlaD [Gammaproteobacteria bacterium]
MLNKAKLELTVGVFVVIGLAALLFLAMKVSSLSSFSSENTYQISAMFENVGGLKVRAPVMMSGVRIGEVSNISLDMETFEARVVFVLGSEYQLPLDTSAAIFTSGLLGEQYISLEPGGEDAVLKAGDQIKLSQSAMVLEQVLGQFLFSKASGDE